MTNWHSDATDHLAEALAKIQSSDEIYLFLEDLCTIKEIMDMSQRLEVASLLKEGTNYHDINLKTGVSTATISRVNKCLSYGSGGYDLALKHIEKGSDNNA